MAFTRESAVELAKNDLAKRLNTEVSEVQELEVSDHEFRDMALGAPEIGEMAAQMISSGWQIRLAVGSESYEYRADKYHVRLHNFNGANYVIQS